MSFVVIGVDMSWAFTWSKDDPTAARDDTIDIARSLVGRAGEGAVTKVGHGRNLVINVGVCR